MTTFPASWTESLLPGGLRRRACEVLRHATGGPCPLSDRQLREQAEQRLTFLAHLAEDHRRAAEDDDDAAVLARLLDRIEELETELDRRDHA